MRGTEFALIGPITTAVGDVVIIVCLADCSPASTFAGCPLQPFLGYGVVVGRGKVESGCLPFAVARGANLLSAAFEAVTTIEQQAQGDTRGVPAGQVAPGQRQETAPPGSGSRSARRTRTTRRPARPGQPPVHRRRHRARRPATPRRTAAGPA